MPDLDGGHYFLTTLAPVRRDPIRRADGSVTAPSHALRETLASLPTAGQSEACVAAGRDSPFSRCRRTHFARFAVIDQPAYNGRDPINAIVGRLKKTDLLVAQPVDCLSRPWLLLAIDFDAGAAADGGLDAYLGGLWSVMEPELRAVYEHCYGFERVTTGAEFAAYLRRCQIETTMPFNDYWIDPPPFASLSLGLVGAVAAGIAVGTLLLGFVAARLLGIAPGWGWLALLPGIVLGIWGALRFVGARGGRPFPTAPDSDLKTVLKALNLQRQFTRFAIAQQGADPNTLHAAFGTFLAATLPADRDRATQAPGVIGG